MCGKFFWIHGHLRDQNFDWSRYYTSATQSGAVPGGLSGNESLKLNSVNALPTAAPTELAVLHF